MSGLIKEKRLQDILKYIEQHGQATAEELSDTFRVSRNTIRRDLDELARLARIRRAYGGALLVPQQSSEPPVVQRLQQNQAVKMAIAQAAAARIQPGTTLFIGSGSTAACVARCLKGHAGLTVITNALNVGVELAGAPGITVIVVGGYMRREELSLIGHITEQGLREVRIEKAIIGIPAIDLQAGLTNDYLPEVVTDRAILDTAPEVILAADHTKFGRVASAYVAPVSRVHTLVTDRETDPAILAGLRGLGVEVVIAG